MQVPGVPTRDSSTQACFGAGTLVHTRDGQVPIEFIQPGDLILGQSEAGGALAHKRVVNTGVYEGRKVMHVRYVLANESLPRSLIVTGNHSFWIQDLGWLQARELKAGQRLQLVDDVEAYIAQTPCTLDTAATHAAELIEGSGKAGRSSTAAGERLLRIRVFNIELEDFHTYFVGEAGVWVHNERFESARLAPVAELHQARGN
jgi:Pretoxin HINT domain